jgi:hypothetical protein
MRLEGNFEKSIEDEWVKKHENEINKMRLEGNFGRSIDGEWVRKHEADEIDYTDDNSKDSYDYLFDDEFYNDLNEYEKIDDDDKAAVSAVRSESDGIAKALEESKIETLWSMEDLGKYTINTPTQEKQTAQNEDKNMQPISELEFKKISKDADKVDIEMQKKLEQMAEELEGIF